MDKNVIRQEPQPGREATGIILAATLLGAAVIRLARIWDNSLWYDELYTVWASRLPLDDLVTEVPASGHPLLYYLIGHVWFAAGAGELRLRMISLVAGLLTVWLAYLLGKELFSRRAGLWAGAFAALSPPLVRYSSEVTDWALMIAAGAAALYFLVLGVKRGRALYWVAFFAACAIAVFSNLLAAPYLVALAAFYLLYDRRPRLRLKAWLISQAALVPVMVVWYLVNSKAEGEVAGRVDSWLSDIFIGIVRAPLAVIVDSNFVDVSLFWGPFLLLMAVAAAALVYRDGHRVLTEGPWMPLLAIIGVTIVVNTVVVVMTQEIGAADLSTRYYIVATLPLLLLAAGAIDSIKVRSIALAAAGALVVASLLQVYLSVRTPIWDYRGVVEVVDAGYREGDVLLAFPNHHYVVAIENYGSRDIDVAGGWIITDAIDEVMFPGPPGTRWNGYIDDAPGDPVTGEELRRQLEAETAGAKRLWIVAGSGEVYRFARSDGVEAALGDGWVETGRWEFEGPLVLKLLERQAP